ncbi:hypothetical protein QBC35DRAFT_533435 [Podospora australis]|uniref:Uncharacterized protein n=1 Tax=Podospora australis TaxID=1536484 RepID=A0AAN6WR04_9PEZI|nr:hypothetical protein QBC35DRAFT_533435 [Podospora australis]
MVRLSHFLVTLVGQSSLVAARSIIPNTENLIPTRGLDTVADGSPAILARAAPEILRPLRNVRRGNTKRDRRAAFALKGEETIYWTGQDGTIAKLSIATPGKSESIVNLELIDDLVQKVTCPAAISGELKLQFAEEADFDDAQDIWQWVNQEEDNHFLLLVGEGDCGANAERILFNVTDLIYNDDKETAVLNVKQTTWKEAAHTFDLTIGKPAVPPKPSGQRTRGLFDKVADGFNKAVDKVTDTVDKVADKTNEIIDKVEDKITDTGGKVVDKISDGIDKIGDKVTDTIDKVADGAQAIPSKVADTVEKIVDKAKAIPATAAELFDPSFTPDISIPFESDLTAKSLTLSVDGIDATVACVTCFTNGSISVEGRFSAKAFKLSEASIEVSLPEDLSATAILSLSVKGDLTQGAAVSRSIDIFKFSPGGISIPGVLTIGPTVGISLGAEIGEIRGGVSVTLGGKVSLPKGSTAKLDFLDENKLSKTGWEVKFEEQPLKADVAVEASASAFLRGIIGVEVSALETGFAAEITANLPSLTASLKAINSGTCSACGNFQAGVQGGLTFGASIGASLTKKAAGADVPLWKLTFAETKSKELAGFCKGIGPQGDQCLALVG